MCLDALNTCINEERPDADNRENRDMRVEITVIGERGMGMLRVLKIEINMISHEKSR